MDYHQDFEFVSKSMLNTFMHSRLDYYHTYISREMPQKSVGKPALTGQVLHAVFEGMELDEIVQPYPQNVLKCNGDLDGKKAAALRDEFPGVVFLKEREYETIQSTVAGVLQNKDLAALLTAEGKREHRVDACVNGVLCKCKPDLLCDLGPRLVCYDFKFMEDVSPGAWHRSSRRFRYWLQHAHYAAVLENTYGKPVTFRFACIETKFPYRCVWRTMDQQSIERCQEAHLGILDDLKRCQETGDWSDNWPDTYVVEPWDLGATEELTDEVQV